MKTFLFFLFYSIFCLSSFSQVSEISTLTNRKSELERMRNILNDSIKRIDTRLNYLKLKENPPQKISSIYTKTKIISDAKIKNKPEVLADIISIIPAGDSLIVYDYFNGYWQIEKDSVTGYTSDLYLAKNQRMLAMLNKRAKNELVNRFGEKTANRITNHEIWIGMTSELVVLSIGYPKEVNKSTYSWGVHEQWIYDNKYIYLENDKLTSWQEQR